MSRLRGPLRPLALWLYGQAARLLAALRRRVGTGVAVVLRAAHLGLALAVSAVLAATIEHGAPLWGFVVLVGVAGLAAVLDAGSAWSTAVLGVIVAEYLVGVLTARLAPPGGLVLYAFVACLYLLHAVAALAAAVPPSARVERLVLLRWAARTGTVLAVTVPLVALPALLGYGSRGGPWLGIAVIAAVVLAAMPLLAFRNRRGG